MTRHCYACDVIFEISDEELARLAKQDLAVPTRCPMCTRTNQRLNTMSLARRREERRP